MLPLTIWIYLSFILPVNLLSFFIWTNHSDHNRGLFVAVCLAVSLFLPPPALSASFSLSLCLSLFILSPSLFIHLSHALFSFWMRSTVAPDRQSVCNPDLMKHCELSWRSIFGVSPWQLKHVWPRLISQPENKNTTFWLFSYTQTYQKGRGTVAGDKLMLTFEDGNQIGPENTRLSLTLAQKPQHTLHKTHTFPWVMPL